MVLWLRLIKLIMTDCRLLKAKGLDPLHICFLFRRHEILRNQFAATVGKRMVTEKTQLTSKTSIMDHHRTVRWSEREYILLLDLVQNNSGIIDAEIRNFDPKKPLFLDYVRVLTGNVQMQAAGMARASMFHGF